MPAVSVIIPTRNRCELLPRAVESARGAASDVEIIVVDDASDDATPEVCAGFSNVRYVRLRRNLGPGSARNVGLISSTAPYISFLDDDDLKMPGSIERQVNLLDAEPGAGMIYGRALYGDENCKPSGGFYPEDCPQGDLFWQLLRWNFIPSPTVVFRRACLARIGLLEESAPGIEDWDLWIRIAELYPVLATETAVAIWRKSNPHSRQFTSHGERLHRAALRLHRDKWLRLPRAAEASVVARQNAAREFAEHASQQLLWEAAETLKAKHLAALARVAFATAQMYPLRVSRKILNAATWRSLLYTRKPEASEQNITE
jgi:glycosyltransferase involved in cell wall biosynthesis